MLQEHLTLPIGAIIQDSNGERYIVEDLLGQGGFSAVYLVRERRGRQRYFALKEMIDPDTQERSQLAFEAELLRKLDHRALPHVYQVFENSKINRIYMLMDYIEGKNLELLRQEQPEQRFSLALALAIMTPIVEAISYLHTRATPIIHRDIKPANIIMPVGTGDAMLVDFGLAKEYVENKTTNVFRYGTPGYAAPEQYGQGTNPRTDIYALGATLYTLLTGLVPVDALTRSVERLKSDPLQPVHILCPAISQTVSQVVAKAMSLHSDDRYNSVEEFWLALSVSILRPNANQFSQIAVTPFPPVLSAEDIKILATTRLLQPTSKGVNTSKGQKQYIRKRTYQRPRSFTRRNVFLALLGVIIVFVVGDLLLVKYFLQTTDVTPKNTQVSVVKPTPTATIDPYQQPAQYCKAIANRSTIDAQDAPRMARCYAGTMHRMDQDDSVTSLVMISKIQQHGDSFTADFIGLNQSGTGEGKILPQNEITFTVKLASNKQYVVITARHDSDRLVGTFQMQNNQREDVGISGSFIALIYQ